MIDTAMQRWRQFSLAKKFSIFSAVVLFAGMILIGSWVTRRIADDVTHNTGQAAALYMEGIVAPLIQEHLSRDELSPETIDRLDALLRQPPIQEQVISMKVWRLDGTIVYSRWRQMIGQKFSISEAFAKAASGTVSAEFETEPHLEDALERAIVSPLLEVYAPVRAKDSRRVIAVSEFYVDGRTLNADLKRAKLWSWLVVGSVTGLMIVALSGIVRSGSRVIEKQQLQLTSQIDELQTLLHQNEDLRRRLQQANEDVSDSHERLLQRIGADLHDGPAQLLSYALLRLGRVEALLQPPSKAAGGTELGAVREVLTSTLNEVRGLSAGLSLPGLLSATLSEAIWMAAVQHQERTATAVELNVGDIPQSASHALKICAFRFVQEGLRNAFRHGGGLGQTVTANGGSCLEIVVADSGPGLAGDLHNIAGLGLTGMRSRIEALGGTLIVDSSIEDGTRLMAKFDIATVLAEEPAHA